VQSFGIYGRHLLVSLVLDLNNWILGSLCSLCLSADTICVPFLCSYFFHTSNSIPHANSYRHLGTIPRVVVYCSFLPDISLNRTYVAHQLENWKAGRYPSGDQWIHCPTVSNSNLDDTSKTHVVEMMCDHEIVVTHAETSNHDKTEVLITKMDRLECHNNMNCQRIVGILSSPLARRLAGWDPWDERS
jgi:hypothetical protein